MHHSAKLSLISRRFSEDFSDLTLTQLDSSDPLVINGVGMISQDERGMLVLKLYQQRSLDTKKVFRYRDERSGGKISSAGGCSLKAIAFAGGNWTCKYLKTRESLHLGEDGCTGIFSGYVDELESTHGVPACFQKSSFEGIIPFELDLPYNLGADGKRNSYPERMLKFTFNKVTKVEILRCDGFTSIKIKNKFELISERFIEAFTHALSIATGSAIKYIWRAIHAESFSQRTISEFDFELANTQLPPPVSLRYGLHFLIFLKTYIQFSLRREHNYFGYWEKLHASWAAGLAVAALPLSVYIEGVLKEFYPELMEAEKGVVEEIESTMAAIQNLTSIDEKVKEQMCNRIGGAAQPSAANALRALVQKGCIAERLVTCWKFVRHRSAHGNDFTLEQIHSKIQKIVSSIYSCLKLFYELLCLKLQFSGYMVDYSKIGFPDEFRFSNRYISIR